MSIRNYVDNAAAKTVPAGCNSSTTSIIVDSTSSLPTVPFTATLDRATASAEQVLVTAAVGTTLTVTRNHGGTGAFSHAAGAAFEHTVDAIDLREANTHVNATGVVHGLSGSIVGTSDSQTLSNKTLASPSFSGTVVGGFTVGGTVSATGFLGDGQRIQIAYAAGQTLPASSTTVLGSVASPAGNDFNTLTGFVPATGTLTITAFTAGQYTISGQIDLSGGITSAGLYKNGSLLAAALTVGNSVFLPPREYALANGDTVDFRVVTTAAARTTSGSASYLLIKRIS